MMNGCIIRGTPIAVDVWQSRQCFSYTSIFFLSHMHADHTAGLTSSWNQPIYCSETSARMLQHKFNIASQLLRPLEVNVAHMIPLDERGEAMMTVSLIDANHCPGSVMFLFEGYFGTILYTGDFRYTSDMFVDTPLALSACKTIDALYLDNTYCNPKCIFSSRAEALVRICNIIQAHQGHQIKIGINTLGKEDLLVDLAMTFKTWIVVNQERLNMLKIIQVKDVFTTNMNDGYIHVVNPRQITKKNMERWNRDHETIAILPTALYTGLNGQPYVNQENVFVVPYSDHSSYSELQDFVSRIKPRKIIPIVDGDSRGPFGQSLSDRADMSCLNDYLNLTKPIPSTTLTNLQRFSNYKRLSVTSSEKRAKPHVSRKFQLKRKSSKCNKIKGVVFDSVITPKKSLVTDSEDMTCNVKQNKITKLYSDIELDGKTALSIGAGLMKKHSDKIVALDGEKDKENCCDRFSFDNSGHINLESDCGTSEDLFSTCSEYSVDTSGSYFSAKSVCEGIVPLTDHQKTSLHIPENFSSDTAYRVKADIDVSIISQSPKSTRNDSHHIEYKARRRESSPEATSTSKYKNDKNGYDNSQIPNQEDNNPIKIIAKQGNVLHTKTEKCIATHDEIKKLNCHLMSVGEDTPDSNHSQSQFTSKITKTDPKDEILYRKLKEQCDECVLNTHSSNEKSQRICTNGREPMQCVTNKLKSRQCSYVSFKHKPNFVSRLTTLNNEHVNDSRKDTVATFINCKGVVQSQDTDETDNVPSSHHSNTHNNVHVHDNYPIMGVGCFSESHCCRDFEIGFSDSVSLSVIPISKRKSEKMKRKNLFNLAKKHIVDL